MLAQSGNQRVMFLKFYSLADTLCLPKTVRQVLGPTTAYVFIYSFIHIVYMVFIIWYSLYVIHGIQLYMVFILNWGVFQFHIESWPECNSDPRPLAYQVHVLITELSGWTCDVLNGLQDQVTMKLKSSLGDCSGRVRITFAANFLYFLYFHAHSANFGQGSLSVATITFQICFLS